MNPLKKKRPARSAAVPSPSKPKPESWKPPFAAKQPSKIFSASEREQAKPIAVEMPKQEKTPAFEFESAKNPGRENPKKGFLAAFEKLTYKHHGWDVWSDFVTMFACAISNSLDAENREKRENLYLSIIKKYDKDEQGLFPELAAWTALALEKDPDQDFLGTLYMELGLGNEHNGQFFTPYSICRTMASVILGDVKDQIDENGYVSISDPCCGAGATLIAAANEAKAQLEKHHMNFQNYILVLGQDIDFTVTMMCYIQLSLLGVAGYFKVGDSITSPMAKGDDPVDYWFTPMYSINPVWRTRRAFDQLDAKSADFSETICYNEDETAK